MIQNEEKKQIRNSSPDPNNEEEEAGREGCDRIGVGPHHLQK